MLFLFQINVQFWTRKVTYGKHAQCVRNFLELKVAQLGMEELTGVHGSVWIFFFTKTGEIQVVGTVVRLSGFFFVFFLLNQS